MKNELTQKLATLEISRMVSHLKSNSNSNPSWAECCREIGRLTPEKWIIVTKNGKRNRSAWEKAHQQLSKEYDAIDSLSKKPEPITF